MSDYYNASGAPSQGSGLTSPNIRAEFNAIAAGFNKFPSLSGNAYKMVYVNAGGTALDVVSGNGLLKLSTSGVPTVAVAGTDYVSDIGLSTFAATGKTTPVDGDSIPLSDSAASNVLKKLTWANLKTTLSATLTSLTGLSGNITFTGTGSRITGDFSGAAASRVAFQSSTVNGATIVNVIPNGTATSTQLQLETDSAVANGSSASIIQTTSEFALKTSNRGTGSLVPMTFYTSNAERMRIDTTGMVDVAVRAKNTALADNDGSFDLSARNNFICTPTGNVTITFTNHTSGQSGFVLFVNTGGYTGHAVAATTKVDTSFLSTINATGTYLISYFDNGTNAYCVTSKVLA